MKSLSRLLLTSALMNSLTAAPILLETDHSLLRLDTKDGKVRSTWFGAKLRNPDDAAPDSPGSQIFHPSHWDASTGPHAVSLIQPDGQIAFDPVYQSHEIVEENGAKHLTISLKDARYPVTMTLHVLAHPRSDVFERWTEITNAGDKPVTVTKSASAQLRLKADTYFLTSFAGTWGAEATMREQQLGKGATVSLTSTSTPKSAAMGSPGFILSLDQPAAEDNGNVILATLAWSGNYALDFTTDSITNELDITCGYQPAYSAYTLDPGKTLASPRLILTHSTAGTGKASRSLHHWARHEGGIRGGNQLRDILLNSWEGAYFKFDEAVLHGMMDGCKQMGVELFVLDDGWFGNLHPRDSDNAGLGDWQINAKKLPNGIKGLVDQATARGLKFGIWVEPEMVNPKSELYEKHPEWVVSLKDHPRREGRNQLVLDLTRPEVQDFIYELMDKLLAENPGISYIKWDCNYTIVDPGSTHLSPAHQQNLQIDYIKGYYDVLDRIIKKHPKVVFQACGSGGGRADYGAMKYHHEFWTSDNTDPYDRVFMQWGSSQFFPAIAMAAHVTESPNHYSKRETPIKFRFDVAMSGRLGLELRPSRLKPEELDFLAKAVPDYKRLRPVIQLGDLYRLKSPYKGDISALQYVREENGKSQSVFLAYLKEHRLINGYGPIALKGLDPAKRYKVTELHPDGGKSILAENGKVLGGDTLLTRGLTPRWTWKFLQSIAVEITEE